MKTQNQIYLYLGLLFIILGLYLRFHDLSLCEFKSDEAEVVKLVKDFLAGGPWPTVGLMSSIDIYNPPIFIYLLVLPGLISTDPYFLTAFITFMAGLALMLAYWATRIAFGLRTALFLSALYACSPWAILYSRKIWEQDLLQPFTAALFLVLVLAAKRKKTKAVIFIPALLAIIVQLHFSGYLVFFGVAFYLLFTVRNQHWNLKFLVLGLIPVTLLFAPYGVHLAKKGGGDIQKIIETSRGKKGGEKRSFSSRSFQYPAQISAGDGFDYLMGPSRADFLKKNRISAGLSSIANKVSQVILVLAFVFALIWVLVGLRRRRFCLYVPARQAPVFLMVVWLAVVSLAFFLSRIKIFPHYFIVDYPILFCIMAYGADRLLSSLQKQPPPFRLMGFALVLTLFFSISLAGAIQWLTFNSYVRKEGGTLGDYGVAFKFKHQVSREIAGWTDRGPLKTGLDQTLRRPLEYTLQRLIEWEKKKLKTCPEKDNAVKIKKIGLIDIRYVRNPDLSKCDLTFFSGPFILCEME